MNAADMARATAPLMARLVLAVFLAIVLLAAPAAMAARPQLNEAYGVKPEAQPTFVGRNGGACDGKPEAECKAPDSGCVWCISSAVPSACYTPVRLLTFANHFVSN